MVNAKTIIKKKKELREIHIDKGLILNNEKGYKCSKCKSEFLTGQALGGHMSKKHPGKSEHYISKIETNKRRTLERIKLIIAKRKFYKELNFDYEKLNKSKNGKMKLKKLINRNRIRKIKSNIDDKEISEYLFPR